MIEIYANMIEIYAHTSNLKSYQIIIIYSFVLVLIMNNFLTSPGRSPYLKI
jgi:hypothetical protein